MDLFSLNKYIKKTVQRMKKDSGPESFSAIDFTDLSLCKPIRKYAFAFVCQEGRLEIGALLLAASLKRFLKCDYELIAAIPLPAEIMGEPREVTRELFKKMGVRMVNIHNKIVSQSRRETHHLITNKMYLLKIPTSADRLIFLDSDVLCYRDFSGDQRFAIPFNGKKVGLGGTRHYEGRWHMFYKALNATMPNIRIRIQYPAGFNYVPPVFSSSFIAINTELASELADCWLQCWETIANKKLVIKYPYHIGQIALAVTIAKMNIPYELIDRDWLYSYFHNYDRLSNIRENEEMPHLVKSLVREYPVITELIKYNPELQFLLK